MKTLIFVRHAKSTWDYPVEDIDRPLAVSGIKDAYLVAKEFRSHRVAIDAVYGSPAARALMTAMIFLRELDFPLKSFSCVRQLYDFSGEKIIQFVRELDNDKNTAMIFGHNHAFTALANKWGSLYVENVPTCGLVRLDFDVTEWKAIAKGITSQNLSPKQLKR